MYINLIHLAKISTGSAERHASRPKPWELLQCVQWKVEAAASYSRDFLATDARTIHTVNVFVHRRFVLPTASANSLCDEGAMPGQRPPTALLGRGEQELFARLACALPKAPFILQKGAPPNCQCFRAGNTGQSSVPRCNQQLYMHYDLIVPNMWAG